MRLWGPERFDPNVVDRKRARGRRQRIVRKMETASTNQAIKIDVKRQSKGPQSYAYTCLVSRLISFCSA